MNTYIKKWIDILVLLWIVFLSSYATFSILHDKVSLFSYEQMYVPIERYRIPEVINIDITEKELRWKEPVEQKGHDIVLTPGDYYSIADDEKKFLISDTEDAFNYGFISRKRANGITYLFSHNSYKYTENSGYHIYNKWKEWDIITFNDTDRYIIKETKMYDFNKGDYKNESVSGKIKIIYFTCTPFWDNIRKAYYLEKL